MYLFPNNSFSQPSDTSNGNFAPPLDIPLLISGNFGDIRNGSFHFGIDFRTQEKTGFPVYCVADGYVARVKVEPGGYGRAVYINHFNGTTSVYAHLEALKGALDVFVKNEQYKRESFFLDYTFAPNQIQVKKCDVIGLSGNGGLSSGPHLHFEIRDTKTQITQNCLLSCFPIADTQAPQIRKLWVFPPFSSFDGSYKGISYPLDYANGMFQLRKQTTITLPHQARLGFEMFDYLTDSVRKLSFTTAKLFVDDTLLYDLTLDALPFDQMGMVNAIYDLQMKDSVNRNVYYMSSFRNQKIRPLKYSKNYGIIDFNDTLTHSIKLYVSDMSGNTSCCEFLACTSATNTPNTATHKARQYCIAPNDGLELQLGQVSVSIPGKALYDDISIAIDTFQYNKRMPFKTIKVGNPNIPLQSYYTVSFDMQDIPAALQPKMVFVGINEKGTPSGLGGRLENQKLTLSTKSFGMFSVLADTIPPDITAINITKGKDMKTEASIVFKISDNLSGIAEYRGTIDGQWVLFEYDFKSGQLLYHFDTTRFKTFANNTHKLVLKVSDKSGNKKTASYTFVK